MASIDTLKILLFVAAVLTFASLLIADSNTKISLLVIGLVILAYSMYETYNLSEKKHTKDFKNKMMLLEGAFMIVILVQVYFASKQLHDSKSASSDVDSKEAKMKKLSSDQLARIEAAKERYRRMTSQKSKPTFHKVSSKVEAPRQTWKPASAPADTLSRSKSVTTQDIEQRLNKLSSLKKPASAPAAPAKTLSLEEIKDELNNLRKLSSKINSSSSRKMQGGGKHIFSGMGVPLN